MAEIGLAQFATIALQVGQAALPAYRRKFAKHQYTQPLRSSTVSVTISTFTKPCRPRASFRPIRAERSGGFGAYEPRCVRISRRTCTADVH